MSALSANRKGSPESKNRGNVVEMKGIEPKIYHVITV